MTPVKGAQAGDRRRSTRSLAGNELIFPSDATLDKVHLIDPDALKNQSYNEQWQAVLGA